ncbi:MAG: glutathione S-transferase family protein [bacterium]|nr:glutathione S-transferase family protein [bacterium]
MSKVLYGVPLSPFVKKVYVVLTLKNIDFELIPVSPMEFPDNYEEIHPMKEIPAFTDGKITIPDSSVICDYLEHKYPETGVYPTSIEKRTKALWLEQYSDTKILEVLGKGFFFEKFVKPAFMNMEPDLDVVKDTLENNLPPVLDYLEKNIKGDFIFGDNITIADISIAAQFLNAEYLGYTVDAENHPKLSALLDSAWQTKGFVECSELDKSLISKFQ